MSSILKAAASGILAQQRNIDVIANNIANMNTTGFKKSRAIFNDTSYDAVQATTNSGALTEISVGNGVSFVAAQRLFSDGGFNETGNPWDMAIAGLGFFQIDLGDGRTAYTRDGSFHVDGEGNLATAGGYLLQPAVKIPAEATNISIDQSGTIVGDVDGEQVQLGKITLVTFTNPEGLLAAGQNLFLASDNSGQPQVGTADNTAIISGVLENSNVDLADEMTKSIEAQRAYQFSIKVLQTADEMLGMANSLRR